MPALTPMLLADNPIGTAGDDDFGFRAHAEQLCDALAETTDLPLTLGVFGPWGSGKTSFLNICRDLLGTRGTTVVWFQPWKYDKRDEVWHALLQTLLNELVRRAAESGGSAGQERVARVWSIVKRLSLAASWLAARQMTTLVTGGLVSADDLVAVRQHAADSDSDDEDAPGSIYHAINRFEADFAHVVDELAGDRRLVIFVDDLDRCRPETALSLLEALRIFMTDTRCVIILAMDHSALIDAAATTWRS